MGAEQKFNGDDGKKIDRIDLIIKKISVSKSYDEVRGVLSDWAQSAFKAGMEAGEDKAIEQMLAAAVIFLNEDEEGDNDETKH